VKRNGDVQNGSIWLKSKEYETVNNTICFNLSTLEYVLFINSVEN